MDRYQDDQPVIVTRSSEESFQTWIDRPYIGEELRRQLAGANVLIVPSEGFLERTDLRHFPTGTEELFHFLRENAPENLSVDICIEDADYRELALHADWLMIATTVVTSVAAKVTAELIWKYIQQRVGSRSKDTSVKSQLIVVDAERGLSLQLSYEGPANEYRAVIVGAIQQYVGDSRGLSLLKQDVQNENCAEPE